MIFVILKPSEIRNRLQVMLWVRKNFFTMDILLQNNRFSIEKEGDTAPDHHPRVFGLNCVQNKQFPASGDTSKEEFDHRYFHR